MLDIRPALAPFFAAFGVAATVTPLGGGPVDTTVVWAGPPSMVVEANAEPSLVDQRARVAVRRDEVPELPPGSTILAPTLAGGTPRLFFVDRVEDERQDPEVWQAVVHE